MAVPILFGLLGLAILLLALAMRVSRNVVAAKSELARVEERRSIARDLHDGLAQELAYIRVQANRLAAAEPDNTEVRRLEAASQRALDEARSAIQALTRDEDEPLHITLTAAAEEIAERGGAQLELNLPTEIVAPPATREALRRIVREAVTNAVRHGQARNVSVSLTNGEGFRVAVRDDGAGFDPDAPRSADGGFGLVSMRERVEALGGTLALDSTPGTGTSIEVVLPCLPTV